MATGKTFSIIFKRNKSMKVIGIPLLFSTLPCQPIAQECDATEAKFLFKSRVQKNKLKL